MPVVYKTMNTIKNKTNDKLIVEKLEAERPVEQRRAVINENRDYIISHVDWAAEGFIQSLESSDVISWDEHRAVKVQPVKMKPFKILEFLSSKQTAEPFDVFCKLLMKIDCETVSHRLQSALRAKNAVDNDIQQGAQKVVEEHYRCSMKSHPRQKDLEKKVAEVLQTERGCWEAKVDSLQGKLNKLQHEMREICSRLHQAVTTRQGESAKKQKGPTDPLGQINAYTEAFQQIIQDLKDQNKELVAESSQVRTNCEEMRWQVHMLEKVKQKQLEEIKKTKRELSDCKKNIKDLNNEMERKDQEKSVQISSLMAALEEKGREIDALIQEKEALSHEMELIGEKVRMVEDSQDRFREETEEKMSFLELKVQHLATFVNPPTSRRSRHHNCSGHGSRGTSTSSASKATPPRVSPGERGPPPTLPPLKKESSRSGKKKSSKK